MNEKERERENERERERRGEKRKGGRERAENCRERGPITQMNHQ